MKKSHNLTDFKLVLLFVPPFFHFFIKKSAVWITHPALLSTDVGIYWTLVCISVTMLNADTITTDANMTVVWKSNNIIFTLKNLTTNLMNNDIISRLQVQRYVVFLYIYQNRGDSRRNRPLFWCRSKNAILELWTCKLALRRAKLLSALSLTT